MLVNDMRSTAGVGDTLNLRPFLAGVERAIDSTRGAHEDCVGILFIDMNREDIRVIDHPLLPGCGALPVFAAVSRLPG